VTAKIIFNGKEYSSPADMPPEERQAYEQLMGVFEGKNRDGMPGVFESLEGVRRPLADKNADGKPDIVEGPQGVNFIASTKTYTDPAQVPPEFRQLYDQAIGMMKEAGPNSAQVVIRSGPTAEAGEARPVNIAAAPPNPPQQTSPVIQNLGTPMWVGLVFVGVLVVLAIGLALLMTRVLQ
jgi:hypothetical protein